MKKKKRNARIRDATAADAPALTRLVVALNTHLGWPECHFNEGKFLRDGVGADRWFDTLVAERDGELVGYAMFHRSYDTESGSRGAYLTDLYVAPDARGAGVGYGLLAAVASRTKDWGGDAVWWVTTEANEVGKTFYRRVAKSVPGVEIWAAVGEDFTGLTAG